MQGFIVLRIIVKTGVMTKTVTEPNVCGLCYKPVMGPVLVTDDEGKRYYYKLVFNGKAMRQNMTPAGNGYIHWDRELCKYLRGVSIEELYRSARAAIREAQGWSLRDDGGNNDLHQLDDVGVDQGGDGEQG